MSMILDALKRDREEARSQGAGPGLDSDHFTDTTGIVTSRALWWAVAVGSVLVVLLAVLIALQLVDDSEPVAPDMPPPATPSSALTTATTLSPSTEIASTLDGARAPQSSLSEDSGASPGARLYAEEPKARATGDLGAMPANDGAMAPEIAALYSHAQEAQIVAPDHHDGAGSARSGTAPDARAPTGPAAAAADTKAPLADAGAPGDTTRNAEPSTPESASEESSIDIEALLRRAQSQLGEPPLTEHTAPPLEELSQQQKDRIPTVLYTVHDWGPSGQARVVLNGQSLQAGQRHGGFTVVEILSDSVVLRWSELEFRLRALNSWVNL